MLEGHPRVGASREGFVLAQAIRAVGERNAYYWTTQSGAELDLLVLAGGRRIGIEAKYSDAPRLAKSMPSARADLRLDRLWVAYPGTLRYALAEWAEALPAEVLPDESAQRAAAAWRAARCPAREVAPRFA